MDGPAGPMAVGISTGLIATLLASVLGGGDARRSQAAAVPDVTAFARPSAPAATPDARRPAGYSPIRPVIEADFPDPTVLKVGSVYYAYATTDGARELQVATGPSLWGPWHRLSGDGLGRLPAWAAGGRTWAPEVIVRHDGGRTTYVLYYAARRHGTDRQCIGAATSPVPYGPFMPTGPDPLVCPLHLGGAIDPAVFVDGDGTRYLLYKTRGDYSDRQPAAIYLQRLTPDALGLDGAPQRILARDAREPVLVEAPELVHRNGRYVLFYAAGWYSDETYQTRYAVASAIGGPYVKAAVPLQSTEGYGKRVVGPGGVDVVSESDGDRLVFHGILDPARGDGERLVRGMYVAELGWADGRPVLRGVTLPYEAENGRRTPALETFRRPRASGRRSVGSPDGRVGRLSLQVYAPGQGGYTFTIRYANGSARPARMELVLNGRQVVPVTLRITRPGEWAAVAVPGDLRPGWNELLLRPLGERVELDRVDVA